MKYPTTLTAADRFEKAAKTLVEKNRANSKKERSPATLAHIKKIQKLVPPGSYQHFKGGKYKVLETVEDVNTGVCYIRYVANYGRYKGVAVLRILVGGPNSFLRPIRRTQYRGVRFTRLK